MAKCGGDEVTPLLPSDLPGQAVRFDGMVQLPGIVEPADGPAWVVLNRLANAQHL